MGLPYRILNRNPKKELLWGLGVGLYRALARDLLEDLKAPKRLCSFKKGVVCLQGFRVSGCMFFFFWGGGVLRGSTSQVLYNGFVSSFNLGLSGSWEVRVQGFGVSVLVLRLLSSLRSIVLGASTSEPKA